MKRPSDPLSVKLYDRDGEALALINIGGAKSASLSIAPTSPRPKYGVLAFAEGTASAPIQVADLDYLAVTTLPPQKGRKKRDRKSTRLNSSHTCAYRMPSSACKKKKY